MEEIIENYEKLCHIQSDINEHLPTLRRYASLCEHITEFGVRGIVSTYALLAGKPKKMVSYDIVDIDMTHIKEAVKDSVDFEFKKGDTSRISIVPTDLLFIDTLHNYRQLSTELGLHARKVKKYIILHDTTSFEFVGESYEGKYEEGLWKAVDEFLNENLNWRIKERFLNNNGLTILERL